MGRLVGRSLTFRHSSPPREAALDGVVPGTPPEGDASRPAMAAGVGASASSSVMPRVPRPPPYAPSFGSEEAPMSGSEGSSPGRGSARGSSMPGWLRRRDVPRLQNDGSRSAANSSFLPKFLQRRRIRDAEQR
mmetsp:Transcript_69094/g.213700  ORF Transcript_69094/g.213700 Transcript_69094/m.213700 type:complete len:133 (+) Transcript_69094:166-564(+)